MEIIIGILGLIIGAGIAFVILSKKNSSKANSVLADAIKEAEQIKKKNFYKQKKNLLSLSLSTTRLLIKRIMRLMIFIKKQNKKRIL